MGKGPVPIGGMILHITAWHWKIFHLQHIDDFPIATPFLDVFQAPWIIRK